jgi:hypothetical protein
LRTVVNLGCIACAILLVMGDAPAKSDGTQEPAVTPRGYVCPRATGPVAIDGRLQDAAWQRAPWSAAFVDIEGESHTPPRFQTRMKMMWDDTCLYIGASLQEPHVCATITRRDAVIFHDNDFEMFLDPDGDNHQYFEFEINALNTGWDLRLVKPYRDGGPPVDSWDIVGLRTAIAVNGTINDPRDRDSGWTVEMAVPWAALRRFAGTRTPPSIGDLWRINFSRVEWQQQVIGGTYQKVPGTKEDNWVWSPQGVIDMHQPEMWGYLEFRTDSGGACRPDPSLPARLKLMALYHGEKKFFVANGRWADTPDQLHLSPDNDVHLTFTTTGWEGRCNFRDDHGMMKTMIVRQDSRLSVSP